MAAKNFYRVKDGVYHGANNQFGPGSIVEMTEAEASGLLDKLVLVEAGEERAGETLGETLVVSVDPPAKARKMKGPTQAPAHTEQAIATADEDED